MKTTTRKDTIAAERARHHAALARLGETCGMKQPVDGLKLWRALRKIERDASNAATAQCNGAAYGGQPFRQDDEDAPGGSEWDTFCAGILARVSRAFGGKPPEGFRFNQDPRGYALKIRGPEAGKPGAFIPAGMVTDWGGNGILATEIN